MKRKEYTITATESVCPGVGAFSLEVPHGASAITLAFCRRPPKGGTAVMSHTVLLPEDMVTSLQRDGYEVTEVKAKAPPKATPKPKTEEAN